MKKQITLAAALAAAALMTAGCFAEETNPLLTTIPNYDNPVGTFAQGPNGEDAVPADDIELTDEQYEAIKEKGLKLAMLWAGAGEWYNGMTDGATAECEKMGIEIVTTADAPSQAATQTQPAAEQNEGAFRDVLQAARLKKLQYDYDGAIRYVKESVPDYESHEELTDFVSACAAEKLSLVKIDNSTITHVFFHILVWDEKTAFSSQNRSAIRTNLYFPSR